MSGPEERPGVWISGSLGPVLGDHNDVDYHFHLAEPSITWPVAAGRIPPPPDPAFVERPVLAGEGVGSPGALAFTGDGGVGKTELAAARFRACRETADVALWVTASSRQAVLSTFQEAAVKLRLDAADADQAAEHLLKWLAGTERTWIVVLDDVADPADMRGLWPQGPAGTVLITTRRNDAELQAVATLVDVEVFTPAESVRYLTGRLEHDARHSPEILDQAGELATDLGHLPLALAHASAVIINDGISCAEYHEMLRDRALSLPEIMPEDPAAAGSGYPTTMPAAWSLALERADALKPAGSAQLLWNVISCLDASGIPEAVLLSEPVRRYLAVGAAGPSGSRRPVSINQARRALRNLHTLSLVRHSHRKPVTTHALAQRAGRESCDPCTLQRAGRVAADALASTWPGDNADAEAIQVAVANTDALRACVPDALWTPDAHAVLFGRGRLTGRLGMVTAATRYFAQLAEESAARLGPGHPDTRLAREEQARWTGTRGDAEQAAALYGDLLADHGPDADGDHGRLALRLAHFTGKAGRYAEAIEQLGALISELERTDGADPAEILRGRRELARWTAYSGQRDRALLMLRSVLADTRRLLGPDHVEVLNTRAEIADAYGQARDRARALREWEELVSDYTRKLGPVHPLSLAARNKLAWWRARAGSLSAAAAELRDLIRDASPVLGSADPGLLEAREGLARLMGRMQSPAQAIPILEEALGERRRNGSWDEPETFTTRANLAGWRGRAGRPDLARREYEEILEDQRRVLGENHPDTLRTRHQIIYWSMPPEADREELRAALETLVADAIRIGGPEHRVTFMARCQLLSLRAGEDVTEELEQLLDAASGHFDANEELPLTLRANLLTLRKAQGDPAARQELRRLLTVVESRLGPAHLLNAVIRHTLSVQPDGSPAGLVEHSILQELGGARRSCPDFLDANEISSVGRRSSLSVGALRNNRNRVDGT